MLHPPKKGVTMNTTIQAHISRLARANENLASVEDMVEKLQVISTRTKDKNKLRKNHQLILKLESKASRLERKIGELTDELGLLKEAG